VLGLARWPLMEVSLSLYYSPLPIANRLICDNPDGILP